MFNKFAVCFVAAVVLSIVPPIIGTLAVTDFDNPRFQRVRQMFREISANRTISTETIFWNPMLMTEDRFLTALCANNVDGNYPNPYNCNEFIMCSGGQVFIWWCPADGSYDPITDVCVYPGVPPHSQCPWRSTWFDPTEVRCDYLGKRLWWSPSILPTDSNESCGREIFYCLRYFLLGYSECPAGFGYSKAFFACIEMYFCKNIDAEFGLD